MNTKSKGNRGEAEVARFLRSRGYALLASQWRCRFGEIDLVVRDPEGVLCFVEVKLRGTGARALPREAVDRRKQEKLRLTAAAYLSFHDMDVPVRFDVGEVYEDDRGGMRVCYLKDAFR